ncbi:hypothetical protein KRR39_08025 [Nocardioides panacis]|uniref:Uncharacterized protein n=1 Tax=Nocardioides panacis TaxID=2849501 RepID=A0A975T290_9ACTN|nr:hypothetical protein [Nocardioides panacis]QWZ09675.1 hypothetical protein KRR39_08025 [Nocardioides panacis]
MRTVVTLTVMARQLVPSSERFSPRVHLIDLRSNCAAMGLDTNDAELRKIVRHPESGLVMCSRSEQEVHLELVSAEDPCELLLSDRALAACREAVAWGQGVQRADRA